MIRKCARCGENAQWYAMDNGYEGWADYYCYWHTPTGWLLEPYFPKKENA